MLKSFKFECGACGTAADYLVEGADGLPDECVECDSTLEFKKLPSRMNTPRKIIADYPGSKKFKAGYQHTHNLDAEKKGSQVSMYRPNK